MTRKFIAKYNDMMLWKEYHPTAKHPVYRLTRQGDVGRFLWSIKGKQYHFAPAANSLWSAKQLTDIKKVMATLEEES